MNVKKNRRKITEIMEVMTENGEMNSVEVKEWFNNNTKHGVTMPWVTNVMRKSGCFVEVGEEKVRSVGGYLHLVKVWDVKR